MAAKHTVDGVSFDDTTHRKITLILKVEANDSMTDGLMTTIHDALEKGEECYFIEETEGNIEDEKCSIYGDLAGRFVENYRKRKALGDNMSEDRV